MQTCERSLSCLSTSIPLSCARTGTMKSSNCRSSWKLSKDSFCVLENMIRRKVENIYIGVIILLKGQQKDRLIILKS